MIKFNSDKQTDYWDMLFQLSNVTKYSDSYLLSLKPKEVERLYREKVVNNNKIRMEESHESTIILKHKPQ